MASNYLESLSKVKLKKDCLILGIESSCDDTCAAVVSGGNEILSNEIISSATEHAKYGGVVPEIASRAHTDAVSQVVKNALSKADIELKDIDAVAVTYGAGLLGALLVGLSFGKTLAYSLRVPLIPVSHIRGHISASYLGNPELKPPYISMLASGGHTAVILVKSELEYEILGSTLDDAIGEAFDKVARCLGLPYPGGPNVERLAQEGKNNIELPKMLKGSKGYDFSYSGLKTAVINYLHSKEQRGEEINRADVACSFQTAAVSVLVDKSVRACEKYGIKVLTCGGGVVANGYLRNSVEQECNKRKIKLYLPEKKLCTDNGAMIAAEGYIQYMARNFADIDLNAQAYLR